MPNKMIVEHLSSMRNQLVYHSIRGEYNEYVQMRKKFAKQFITFPTEAQYLANKHTNVSIFSREGINVLKTWFKEFFRKKTPDEIEMERLAQDIKDKRKSGLIA